MSPSPPSQNRDQRPRRGGPPARAPQSPQQPDAREAIAMLDHLAERFDDCVGADVRRFRRRAADIREAFRAEPRSPKRVGRRRGRPNRRPPADPAAAIVRLEEDVAASIDRRRARADRLPKPSYPPDLPVVERRDEIAAAIRDNQVVVICGETGSGKTTQIPKICLELGRGVDGYIGHTQPRRLAARNVAARIAEELESPLGKDVGFKIRFTDSTSPAGYVKLMTDGILLAETQTDRLLDAYDTIIIDEAHERSLNIDFLLGYLKQILPRRPDLKLVITSATIDPERFSKHFNNCPIIMVEGRAYPVETRYRPIAELSEDPNVDPRAGDLDPMFRGVLDAVDELCSADLGDILIFMPGEREIRQTAKALREHTWYADGRTPEILPLYARLSAAEQQRVFKPHGSRRIVIATNVAETSVTVPGITGVVDPGVARLNRYSARSRVQRLEIEPISRASADQRKGRCGRVAPGICVRLYSEDDYRRRDEFTDPEIQRTNLASVILQMKALRLGPVERFPFVEAPEQRRIRDGYETLRELGALDEEDKLTPLGRDIARMPIDPRLARMVVAAKEEDCLEEVLVLASALSVQDPRERPMDKRDAADEAHAKFNDPKSDFITLINIWHFYREQAEKLSRSKLGKACTQNFLSLIRLREWQDVHRQLRDLVRDLGYKPNTKPAEPQQIHRAMLTGLLGNVGVKGDRHEFNGCRGVKFHVFPGSALFSSPPKWVMAAELVSTTRLFARMCAAIEPEWIEQLAPHLVTRTYTEPRWDSRHGKVLADEKVSLYGLTIVPKRTVHYGPVDPVESRRIFIHNALVEGDLRTELAFLEQNKALQAEIEDLQARARRRDILGEQRVRFDFYDARVPRDVVNASTFLKWAKVAVRENPDVLTMRREDLLAADETLVSREAYPDRIEVSGSPLRLEYRHAPLTPDDGVTVTVPLELLPRLDAERLAWLVPGMLKDKVLALIKGLPKKYRTSFVPASDYAERVAATIRPGQGELAKEVGESLRRLTGVNVPPEAWPATGLEEHLRMNIRVVDAAGNVAAEGRDLDALRRELSATVRETLAQAPEEKYTRDGITSWDFGELPERVTLERAGTTVEAFPALADRGKDVALALAETPELAQAQTLRGLRRLAYLSCRREVEFQLRHLPGLDKVLMLAASRPGGTEGLRDQFAMLIVDRAFLEDRPVVRTAERFAGVIDRGAPKVGRVAHELLPTVQAIVAGEHEVRLALSKKTPDAWRASLDDIAEQVRWLLPDDVLTQTPPERLKHLPRYLETIRRRLSKLANGGHARDRELAAEVAPYWKAFLTASGLRGARTAAAVETFRWMIEEYRVSIFAQELGTSVKVSPKRLQNQWDEIRKLAPTGT